MDDIKDEIENKSQMLATKEDVAKVKVEMIKWMFAFWVTLVLLIVGIYLK